MTHKLNMLDRVAGRIMDRDSPAYGDERERTVFMEPSSFALTTGLHAGLLGGMAQGAVVGGIIGGLAAIVGGMLSFRQARRHRHEVDHRHP